MRGNCAPAILLFCLLAMTRLPAQYCIPTSEAGTTDNDYIDGVELNTISNLGTGGGDGTGYTDFTGISTMLAAEDTFTITVYNTPDWPEYYTAWIDYNQDSDFSDDEKLFPATAISAGGDASFDFVVPAGAAPGITRMRVRCNYASSGFGACEEETWSEAEDYTIVITGLPDDIGVQSLVTPVSSCDLGGSESVTVQLRNFGTNDESGFSVSYIADGGAIVTDAFPGVLPAGTTFDYTFSVPADLSAAGPHSITAWTGLAGDDFPADDTLYAALTHVSTYLTTGFSASVCDPGTTILPSPIAGGGTWSGTGIVNPATGELDPSIVGLGNSTVITYDFVPAADYTVTEIPYSIFASGDPDILSLTDDSYDLQPLGFTFRFFGNAYSSVNICSNGFLNFGTGSTSYTVAAIPDPGTPNNMIDFCWTDLNPGAGGTISCETQGSAPWRRFVVNFDHVTHYGSAYTVTGQVVLYETSNVIDIIATDIQSDGGNMTQGIENDLGSEGYVTAVMYNDNPFSMWNTAYRFAPTPCPGTVTDTITVIDEPTVDLGPDISVCGPATITLDAGPGANQYLWNTGQSTQSIEVSTTGNYSVNYSLGSGCEASDTISVTISPTPIVNLGTDDTTCESAILDAGNPGLNYLWNTGAETQTIPVTGSGTYAVTVTDPASGCHASDTVNLNVVALPIADFTGTTDDGLTWHFTSLASGAAIWLWDFGDGGTAAVENPDHTYLQPGNYAVKLIVTNDCGTDLIDSPLVAFTGIGGSQENFNAGIYPDPADRVLHVFSGNPSNLASEIAIWSSAGARVYDIVLPAGNALRRDIDISAFPAGIYVLLLSSEDSARKFPFVVSH